MRGTHPNSHQPHMTVDKVLAKCVADLVTDCVLWTGATSRKGYGHVGADRRYQIVHRYVYEQLVGPIPEGLTLDHLCKVKCCVNPDHLEPVTFSENSKRAWIGRPRVEHCTGCGGPRDGIWMCAPCRSNYNREWRKSHVQTA